MFDFLMVFDKQLIGKLIREAPALSGAISLLFFNKKLIEKLIRDVPQLSGAFSLLEQDFLFPNLTAVRLGGRVSDRT